MLPLISHLTARMILDSRGTPTVEATCHLTDGRSATGSVPSGASTGTFEAVELRDNNKLSFQGLNVLSAVNNVINELSPQVAGEQAWDQTKLDQALIDLDGTDNKSKLGANAILAASIAVCKAGALTKNVPVYQHIADLCDNDKVLSIPTPFFNILNGGLHAGMNLDFQEFIIVPNPKRIAQYPQQLETGSNIARSLKKTLTKHKFPTSTGDEGGFAPVLSKNRYAVDLIAETCHEAQVNFKDDVQISFDFASNSYFKNNRFYLKDSAHPIDIRHYQGYLEKLITDYKPYSFEDPFPEDAWTDWTKFSAAFGDRVVLIGDDFLVTNPKRLDRAIKEKACNAILIKPNQIGTVTETLAVVKKAHDHHFKTVVSHRSGETTDDFIADFSVGCGAGHVKFGAPVRGERVVKYNRLLAIYHELIA